MCSRSNKNSVISVKELQVDFSVPPPSRCVIKSDSRPPETLSTWLTPSRALSIAQKINCLSYRRKQKQPSLMCMYLNSASFPSSQKFLPLRKRQILLNLARSYQGKPTRKARCEEGRSISDGTSRLIIDGRRQRWMQRRGTLWTQRETYPQQHQQSTKIRPRLSEGSNFLGLQKHRSALLFTACL